jgi:hypothetical protein
VFLVDVDVPSNSQSKAAFCAIQYAMLNSISGIITAVLQIVMKTWSHRVSKYTFLSYYSEKASSYIHMFICFEVLLLKSLTLFKPCRRTISKTLKNMVKFISGNVNLESTPVSCLFFYT